MPAIAEPIEQTEEFKDIQMAIEVSDYSKRHLRINGAEPPQTSTSTVVDYAMNLLSTFTFFSLTQKLLRLRQLSANWDSYNAEPPNEAALARAQQLLLRFFERGIVPTDVVPSSEGGVAITFNHGERYADLECLNSGETLAVTAVGNEQPRAWEVENGGITVFDTLERIRVHTIS
jgi:hypothetical protein